jgi:hypothetical protein
MSGDRGAPRGAFIVLEGPDRCGKSTQTRLLKEHLERSNVRGGRRARPAALPPRRPGPRRRPTPPAQGPATAPLRPCRPCRAPQARVEMWNFPDRSSRSGQVINQYLAKQLELSDAEVHELFSQNRREKM